MCLIRILGNGPSGISLSNILAGNLPYFNGKVPECPEPVDSFLYDKCKRNMEMSIVEQVCELMKLDLTQILAILLEKQE